MRLVPIVAALLALGCDGDLPDACDALNPIDTVTQPYQHRCSTLNPTLETNADSPEFGMASCSVIDGQFSVEHPQFCDCAEEGYAPLSDDEADAASARARQEGWCRDACCLEMCFCELRQLTGDDLHACQEEGVRGGRNGWCYVAPNRGVGTLEAIERYHHSETYCANPQAILYTGDYLDGLRFTTCWR